MYSMARFGFWTSEKQWYDFIEGTNTEFTKALKKEGVLEYKIVDGKHGRMVRLKDLDRMTAFKLIKSTKRKSPLGHNDTYFLTMKPRLDAVVES